MSHVRTIALVLTIVVSALAGWQRGSANADVVTVGESLPGIDLAVPGAPRLVKGWCNQACTQACAAHGGCDDIRVLGCDCYWMCDDGYDGHTYCAGSVGVKVCNDVAEIITRPSVAALIMTAGTR